MRHKGGDLPYGQRAEAGQVVPDPYEADVLRCVAACHREGLSLRQTARALALAGFKPRRGRAWHPTQVNRMLPRAPAPPAR